MMPAVPNQKLETKCVNPDCGYVEPMFQATRDLVDRGLPIHCSKCGEYADVRRVATEPTDDPNNPANNDAGQTKSARS